jgi:pyruvate-formate lyase
VPGAFCWIVHEQLGRVCGATPDGRKAGFPFADGGGAAQGRERNGPTSAILSTTSWDHAPLIGGVAYNMKFNSTLFDSPASVKRLEELLVTYLRHGGFEVQVNVLNLDTLAKARENPEQFRDLVVRIGGYTDYFTRLSPHMQEEVMMRTDYGGI